MADNVRAIALRAPRHSAKPEPSVPLSRPSGRVSAIADLQGLLNETIRLRKCVEQWPEESARLSILIRDERRLRRMLEAV